MNWHKFLTAVVSIGSFVALKFIPVGAVLIVGPLTLPASALIAGSLALFAAVGITPEKVAPKIAAILGTAASCPPVGDSPHMTE